MSVKTGAFLLTWSQTRVDGISGGPVSSLVPGAEWSWRGQAMSLHQDPTKCDRQLTRTVAKALPLGRFLDGIGGEEPRVRQAILLTDGIQFFEACLIEVIELAAPLVLFVKDVPPQDVVLRVIDPEASSPPANLVHAVAQSEFPLATAGR